MARERTTLDVWDIQVNYGQGDGWESEIEEFSWFAAKEQLKTSSIHSAGLRSGESTMATRKSILEQAADKAVEKYA